MVVSEARGENSLRSCCVAGRDLYRMPARAWPAPALRPSAAPHFCEDRAQSPSRGPLPSPNLGFLSLLTAASALQLL